MHSKISALGIKKIILILVFGFTLFGGNVFAGDTNNGQFTTSAGVTKPITTEQRINAREAGVQEGTLTKRLDRNGDTLYENRITKDAVQSFEKQEMTKYESENPTTTTTTTINSTPGGNSPDGTNNETKYIQDTYNQLSDENKKAFNDKYGTDLSKVNNEEAINFAEDKLASQPDDSSSSSEGIQVHVTEKIPGADCDGSDGDYTCTVQPGFKTVMQLMGGIIKYFTYLAALGGVLFIVINGMMLSMGSLGGNKDEIKKKITMTIGGLILLLLSGLILNAIAPWIYK